MSASWNMVGSDLVLENSLIESALAPIMTSLILCKTNSAFYNPLQSSHLQSLRTWEFGVPLLINLSTDVTFTVSGTSFITNGITLQKGWNFITYTGEAEVTPDQLFGSQLSKLVYIKTFDEWYNPYNALSSLQRIIPGEAYFIKLNDEATLSW
ncbi:MAG: hypothetical protein IPO21_04925 [Bacteroidales bacterium]|nr:hypothetical protein [Bacteroidales bacterium]